MIAPWSWIRRQTLAAQFALAAAPLVLAFAFLAGSFLSDMAGRVLVEQRASSSALLLHNLIQPAIADLTAADGAARKAAQEALSAALADPVNAGRFPYLEVWRPDGTLIYSRSAWLIGRRYPLPLPAQRALKGDVVADYTDVTAGEHRDRNIRKAYLEIYNPIRASDSAEIVAVAEIHEDRALLGGEIRRIGLVSHLVVGVTSLAMLALLSLVVRAGSRTIDRQRAALLDAVRHAEEREEQIKDLHQRQMLAAQDLAAMNERIARSIGADLHDGPAQTIGYAVLSLDRVRKAGRKAERDALIGTIEAHLVGALGQIRSTARMLVLPEVEALPLAGVVQAAIDQHEKKTGSRVATRLALPDDAADFPPAVKICLFRVLQEGLNNAFVHADGRGQQVAVTLDGGRLTASVSDAGPAGPKPQTTARAGFGLAGLRYRIESVGGQMDFSPLPGGGSRLTLTLDRPS